MRASAIALVAAMAACAVTSEGRAQQLVYTPTNPSFGGNPFNGSHLQGLADAQNQFKDESEYAPPTQAELFAQQLQSSILSGVAQQLSNAIFGENPAQTGTISFGGTTVSFVRGLDSVTINITDPLGVATQIIVPTFVRGG